MQVDRQERFYVSAFALLFPYETARVTCSNLFRLGYKRIGLCCQASYDERYEQRFSSALQGICNHCSQIPIKPYLYKTPPTAEKLDHWINEEHPDVILTNHAAPQLAAAIHRTGRSIPDDIGLAELDVPDENSRLSGTLVSYEKAGSSAVDLLSVMLANNETGQQPVRGILIPSQWHEGNTVVRQ